MKRKKNEREKIILIHNKKILFVIIVLLIILFLLIICFLNKKQAEVAVKECFSDSDCVKQRVTCCPCQMGGKEICMSEQNATYWKTNLIQECSQDSGCIAQYNCNDAGCACKNGKCVLA